MPPVGPRGDRPPPQTWPSRLVCKYRWADGVGWGSPHMRQGMAQTPPHALCQGTSYTARGRVHFITVCGAGGGGIGAVPLQGIGGSSRVWQAMQRARHHMPLRGDVEAAASEPADRRRPRQQAGSASAASARHCPRQQVGGVRGSRQAVYEATGRRPVAVRRCPSTAARGMRGGKLDQPSAPGPPDVIARLVGLVA